MRRFTHTFPQRISAFLLCLALLVGLLPLSALAKDDHHDHNGWTALTVNTIKEDGTLDPGQYYLSKDVTYAGSNSIMITGTVTLCLNGHVLNLGGKNIKIDNGGALTLCDCNPVTTWGYLDSDGLWHAGSSTDDTGSPCDLTGGVITGGQGYDAGIFTFGGGVYVRNGTFTMEGGNIAGNTSAKGDGGGVYVNNGNNFTMNGGTITGNSAMDYRGGYGGGVCSYSDFIMNDGSIAYNTATHSGGGVCLWYEDCTFTMNGGSITGNHATHSGGLYMYDASFTMNGGSITGNHASDSGVGGDRRSLVTISGSPVIQNNTKPDGVPCNVYLKESQHITIGGKLTNARIGVTMESPGSFTSGWVTDMQGQNPAKYFTVDDSSYGIGLNADGEVVMGSLCTTITLNPNGGTLPAYSLVVGAALPIPTKTGYTFAGWYENPEFSGNPVADVPADSTGELTFYAKWTANTYTVTFDANGGTINNGDVTEYTYGVGATLPTDVTREGYAFDGWYEQSDFSGSKVTKITATDTGDKTYYAKWLSTDAGVASVSVNGVVGNISGNQITVTLPPNSALPDGTDDITITPAAGAVSSNLTISTGTESVTYTFTVTAEDGQTTAKYIVTVTAPPEPTPPPYIPPTYAVTVPETTGGTVEVSPSRASSGRRVTITTQPAPGYELESLTVLDSRGSEIALTDQGDGKYTFTMPSRKVTVEASFAPVPLPFEDVPPGAWYEEAVRYAYFHNIMEGMSATKFSPNISLTRAQAVQVLYNLEGQPAVSESSTFPDLVYEWYKPAIAWAESTGVVDGYEDGTFQPGDSITRQEFAQMLYNYGAYKDYDLSAQGDLSSFPDGDSVQEWAVPAMAWANGNALINGHDDGTLEPGGTATRAQAASILMRFDQNVVEN